MENWDPELLERQQAVSRTSANSTATYFQTAAVVPDTGHRQAYLEEVFSPVLSDT